MKRGRLITPSEALTTMRSAPKRIVGNYVEIMVDGKWLHLCRGDDCGQVWGSYAVASAGDSVDEYVESMISRSLWEGVPWDEVVAASYLDGAEMDDEKFVFIDSATDG